MNFSQLDKTPAGTAGAPEGEGWNNQCPALPPWANAILESNAFRRLEEITFLGILSPRYAPSSKVDRPDFMDDGTRADHSIGVAAIALDFAHDFGFPEEDQRYAVAWGLTHDIATWPLSHTSEPAFEDILQRPSRDIRRDILLNKKIPNIYSLKGPLKRCGIDLHLLLQLFDREESPQQGNLALLWRLIHSPITPDTLEGMHRAGRVFGVAVPSPKEIRKAVWKEGEQICFDAQPCSPIARFWEAKGLIYNDFINRPDVVYQESATARKIYVNLRRRRISAVGHCLKLSEQDVLQIPEDPQLPLDFPLEVFRYKPPQDYQVDQERWRQLGANAPLERLSETLIKSPRKIPSHVALRSRASA